MPLDPKLIEEVEAIFVERPDLLDTFLKDLAPIVKDDRPAEVEKP